MKRALASIAGLVGLAALGRWFSKRRHPVETAAEPVEATTDGDPAEELRRKLADARGPEPGPEPGALPDPASAPVDETLDERRARVHAKAREAIDSMGDGGDAS